MNLQEKGDCGVTAGSWRKMLAGGTALAVPYFLWTAIAFGHGAVSHVPGDENFGVVVGRYQFLLEGKYKAILSGKQTRLVVRVYDMKRGAPLLGARLLVAPKLPQAFAELPKKSEIPPAMRNLGSMNSSHSKSPPPGSPLTWTGDGRIDLTDFRPAPEGTEPGHYGVDFTPQITGPYLLQVALLQPGKDGRPEVLTQLPFEVRAPPWINFRMWISLGGILFAFTVGTYALRIRLRRPAPAGEAFNLLELPWLSRLLRSSFWQPLFQVPLLLVFVAVLVLGFVDTQVSSRNLSTILMWTLWWAGIIFTFVLAGRAWCAVCPIGAVSEWSNRYTGSERQLPRRFRTLWVATALFLLLTWADGYFGIVRSPIRTAWLFLLLGALAVAVGAHYARRTFCRYLCPIGGVIGLYSMFAPVELRVKSQVVCKEDRTKACYVGNEEGRGCPMFEFPERMDSNNFCNYCGECLKTCLQDNITLRFRAFGRDLWTAGSRTADEAFLAAAMVAVAGTAAGHMVGQWHEWMDALAAYIPFAALGVTEHLAIERTMFTLVFWFSALLLPVLVYLASRLTWRLSGRPADIPPAGLFVIFGYAFIPLGLAMHLAHNLPHFFLEGPMVVPAFQKTVSMFTPWQMGVPNWSPALWLEPPVLYWLQMLILLVSLLYSLYTAYRLSAGRWGSAFLSLRGPWPYLVLMLLIALADAYLLNLPMGSRHMG
ncbi:4Fe-4S binding protein [Nitrospinota bacterium]